MDCMKSDMKEKGYVSDNAMSDRTEWKKKTCCARRPKIKMMMTKIIKRRVDKSKKK